MRHAKAFGIALGTFVGLWAVAALVISYGAGAVDHVAPGIGSKIKSFFPGVA